MVYNYATGNLTSRRDAIRVRKEEFTYNALDRLITAKTTNVTTSGVVADLTYSYDGSVGGTTKGNLTQRTDIGKFNYSSAHAPTRAFGTSPGSTPPAVIPQYTQTITYNSFLQPVTITEPNAGSGNVLTYAYGPDHDRARLQDERVPLYPAFQAAVGCGLYRGFQLVRKAGHIGQRYLRSGVVDVVGQFGDHVTQQREQPYGGQREHGQFDVRSHDGTGLVFRIAHPAGSGGPTTRPAERSHQHDRVCPPLRSYVPINTIGYRPHHGHMCPPVRSGVSSATIA